MKCPYIKQNVTITTAFTLKYEDGNCEAWNKIDNTSVELMNCLKDECGAWRNGRCNFREG